MVSKEPIFIIIGPHPFGPWAKNEAHEAHSRPSSLNPPKAFRPLLVRLQSGAALLISDRCPAHSFPPALCIISGSFAVPGRQATAASSPSAAAALSLINQARSREAAKRFSMSTLKEILTRRPVSATIRLTVPAGGARPAPPVGPALGQYRLNLMAFCKDFNARTQKYKPDTPMAVTITAFKDNTFEFTVKSPSVTWYLKKAAGIESGSSRPGHAVASTLSVRHIYEIAKVKQSDPYCQYMSLESICKSIIGTANSMGIQVVKDLD